MKEFRCHAVSCLISATSYLQEKLPLNNEVIKDARFLCPINKNIKNALNGISCLALTYGKLFKTSLPMVFNLKSDSVDDYKLCDIIKVHTISNRNYEWRVLYTRYTQRGK